MTGSVNSFSVDKKGKLGLSGLLIKGDLIDNVNIIITGFYMDRQDRLNRCAY